MKYNDSEIAFGMISDVVVHYNASYFVVGVFK